MIDEQPTSKGGSDRGQAYTLEGFIGAIVVLLAVLFALQSVVIAPTTGGLADRSVQSQIQQETQDALVVTEQDENLTEMIEEMDDDEAFDEENRSDPYYDDTEDFEKNTTLGKILESEDRSYNVELYYRDNESDDYLETSVVRQSGSAGPPSSSAVSASYVVTMFGDEGDFDSLPQHPNHDDSDDPVYTLVEVRVIVW
ncbi:hypothetical protein ACFQGT_01040 [Natrialbaceae archaeon GCM10025810]|uniref:DUF7288 family protein n=1 Tax=Halovalidus salilacus TaxID=3075124 RepID=UPI003612C07D